MEKVNSLMISSYVASSGCDMTTFALFSFASNMTRLDIKNTIEGEGPEGESWGDGRDGRGGRKHLFLEHYWLKIKTYRGPTPRAQGLPRAKGLTTNNMDKIALRFGSDLVVAISAKPQA